MPPETSDGESGAAWGGDLSGEQFTSENGSDRETEMQYGPKKEKKKGNKRKAEKPQMKCISEKRGNNILKKGECVGQNHGERVETMSVPPVMAVGA